MGIHSEMLIDNSFVRTFDEKSHEEIREVEIEEKKVAGKRGDLSRFSKMKAEIIFFEEAKIIRSAKRQIQHLFNWMKEMNDFRTRRIVAANLFSYLAEINEVELNKLTPKMKENVEYIKKQYLYIDKADVLDDMMKVVYEMTALNGDDLYDVLVKNNDEKDVAEYFKNIARETEITVPMIRKWSMAHRGYTYKRAIEYLSKDFKDKEDAYLNTSTVFVIKSENKVRRIQDRVTELCTLFCELDYYKINEYKDRTQNEMLEFIFEELDSVGFVRPTLAVKSRGLHLYWAINPLAYFQFNEWKMMQQKIHQILEKFGADSKTTTDTVRLLRLVGSIHSGTKKRITGIEYTSDRYNFDELKELYIKEECKKDYEKRLKMRKKMATAAKKKQVFKVFSGGGKTEGKSLTAGHQVSYAIYKDYLNDIFTLVDLRNGEMTGNREFCCFLVRYWTLCLTHNKMKAIQALEKMYFALDASVKYSLDQMIDFTKSAEKQYESWLKDWRKGYNYSNDKLLKLLEITEVEEKHLTKIMSKNEAKRRKDKRNKEYYKKNNSKHISNELVTQTIISVIKKNPNLSIAKITEAVKKEVGKCGRDKVIAIRKELFNK